MEHDLVFSDVLDLQPVIDELEVRFERIEPEVQAFLPEPGRFERLRAEAEALTSRFPDPEARPPLFGVPVGVKDIFHTAGFPTRAGSALPEEVLAGPEGRAVRLLREAGVLIVGKTVTTEFAYFAHGPTRNPRNLRHTPGGSSSGSAAAVAAGLCTLALGTQTIGSVIRPAAFCGVIGYKPSYGRIPTSGVIPLSPALDHVGVFTAGLPLLEACARLLVSGWKQPDTSPGRVLGIPVGPYLGHASEAARANLAEAADKLIDAGYQIRQVPLFSAFEDIVERHYALVAAEAAIVHKAWFAEYRERYHPKTAMLLETGRKIARERLVQLRSQRTALRNELGALMVANDIDAWIAPSAPGAAPEGLESTGDPVMNLPWTQAGLPAVNLPSGLDPEGLPYGVQLVGRFGGDEALLALAGRLASWIVPWEVAG